MDRQRIEKDHIVARYLAGQLNEAERSEFESYYADHREVVKDIERTLRLREGLAVLHERGELEPLVRARPRAAWPMALGLAAALGVLAVGVWLWVSQGTVTPIVNTLAALQDRSGAPLSVASSHVLVRLRGPSSDVAIPLPHERGAIELRILPSAHTENGSFRVLLGQLDAADAIAPLGDTRAQASAEDGFVTTWLDSAGLSTGRYVVELIPAGGEAAGLPSDRFVIELR